MATLSNEIVLRPRFQIKLESPKEEALQCFEGEVEKPFLVKRLDDHIFIKFNKKEAHFWSPQLHLEINDEDDGNSKLYGSTGWRANRIGGDARKPARHLHRHYTATVPQRRLRNG